MKVFLLGGAVGGEDLMAVRVVFFGGVCASEDSENTGVPCLKGVFSESEFETPSKEEEERAILADLRVGLADFEG